MKIGLLGHGIVGSGVTGIIDQKNLYGLVVDKILVKDQEEMTDARCTMNADDILDDPQIDIVVECMGGIEPARSFLLRALNNGKHIVTSNKKMLAECGKELFRAAEENGCVIGFEATCGGGTPWLANIERIRRIEDIDSFRGIFNGTTNYILSRMYDENADFNEMLREAQKAGYAERDPSDDIDGHDVRFKVALSTAKAFGLMCDPAAIPAFGIRNISFRDMEYAKKNGYALKLIGRGIRKNDHQNIFVIPAMIPEKDPFANIGLNYNVTESVSKTLGKALFVAQGAGSLPTAHAVVQDLIDLAQNRKQPEQFKEDARIDNSDYEAEFYIRLDQPQNGDWIASNVAENTYLTKRISLQKLEEILNAHENDNVFVAEVIHS